MPITFVGAGANSAVSNNGSSATLALPAGVAADDLLLLVANFAPSCTFTAVPAGWVAVAGGSPPNQFSGQPVVYRKVAGASEAGVAITMNDDGGGRLSNFVVLAYRGVDTSAPVDAVSYNASEQYNVTTVVMPSVTATKAGDAVLGLAFESQNHAATMSVNGALGAAAVINTVPAYAVGHNLNVGGAGSVNPGSFASAEQRVFKTMTIALAQPGAGDSTPPTLTGSLTVGGVTSNSIQITWPAGSDNVAVSGYETSLDGATWTARGTVLTYTFTGLTDGTSYTPRVRAKDGAGNASAPPLQVTQSTQNAGGATGITLLAPNPSSGAVGAPSANFTAGANGAITGTVIVTPSDNGGGTFAPASVQISAGTPTATFTYTPASAGAKTISIANNGGLANPANATYTATAVGTFTSGTLSRNTGGAVVNTSLAWLTLLAEASGAFAVTKTNVTVNSAGTFSVPNDAALTVGTAYLAIWKESTGVHGWGVAVAS